MQSLQRVCLLIGCIWILFFSVNPAIASDMKIPYSLSNGNQVIPGGQSIGIKLHSSGVLVVGYHFIHSGKLIFSPGERGNIHIGDVIIKVNGKAASKVEDVAKQIEQAGIHGQQINFEFKRKGEVLSTKLSPKLDEDSGVYRIGLYIRDSASGVGTLTYYDPAHKKFAALGHVVTDADTGQTIDGEGVIVRAAVTSIDRGESGQPGEKRSSFVNENKILGHISRNTAYGVFGTLTARPDDSLVNTPLSIASPEEVKPGPAKILTVIHDQKVEAFDALIIQVNAQHSAEIKSFIIKVTDPRLLKSTGGIIQGMSGSPVIAQHKLIGAVTHVFLADPTRGYGVFAAWMNENLRKVKPAA